MLTEKFQGEPTHPIEYDTLRFYYNSKGDPVRLDYAVNSTGKPDYFFTYDNKGRLIELVTKYGSFIEFTHKYYITIINSLRMILHFTLIKASK